ncbi:MAG: potassium channel family protein [Desulfurococcaceae archaeon]|nr:potassium channel family protein [Desulfurococcaceae archaeon]
MSVNALGRVREVMSHPLVEIAMAYAVIISVIIVLVDYTMPLRDDLRMQLYTVDAIVVLLLLLDLAVRALRSGSPLRYLASNWYEIPALTPLYAFAIIEQVPSIAGLVRLLRMLRLLRLTLLFLRGSAIARALLEASRTLQFSTVVGVLALTTLTSAFTFYIVESAGGSGSVKSFWDSLWWALATVTTVGYGDIVPETPAGRVIGAITMLVGIGVYSAFIGLVAATLTQVSRAQRDPELEDIKSRIDRLESLSERELEELVDSIKRRWARLKERA